MYSNNRTVIVVGRGGRSSHCMCCAVRVAWPGLQEPGQRAGVAHWASSQSQATPEKFPKRASSWCSAGTAHSTAQRSTHDTHLQASDTKPHRTFCADVLIAWNYSSILFAFVSSPTQHRLFVREIVLTAVCSPPSGFPFRTTTRHHDLNPRAYAIGEAVVVAVVGRSRCSVKQRHCIDPQRHIHLVPGAEGSPRAVQPGHRRKRCKGGAA